MTSLVRLVWTAWPRSRTAVALMVSSVHTGGLGGPAVVDAARRAGWPGDLDKDRSAGAAFPDGTWATVEGTRTPVGDAAAESMPDAGNCWSDVPCVVDAGPAWGA